MKPGLGDAVVEATLKLEQMVADKLELPGSTLGDPAVIQAIRAHLSPAGLRLFNWWNKKRNAIIHYGKNKKQENERAEIRNSSDPKVLRDTGGMIAVLLAGWKKNESEVEDTCRDLLPDEVFEEIFGKARKNPALVSDPPRGGKCPNDKLASSKNDEKTIDDSDLFMKNFGEINWDQTNQVPPNKLKPNFKVESDDLKLIIIEPPILIPDLAARLGLLPFNIMADLIKIGVFPAPNQPLEPEIAAQICEVHGFIFEGHRADKDQRKGPPRNLESGPTKSGGTGPFLGAAEV